MEALFATELIRIVMRPGNACTMSCLPGQKAVVLHSRFVSGPREESGLERTLEP